MTDKIRQEFIHHATELAQDHMILRRELLKARRSIAGMNQETLAGILGWSVKKVKRFENYDGDPRLSDVRQYALAVGATFQTEVKELP